MKYISQSIRVCCIFFVTATLSAPSFSQHQVQEQSAFRLSAGYHNKYTRTEIAYETPSLFRSNNHRFDIRLEASLAYFHTHHTPLASKSRNNLWQLGVTPMLRWWINDRWYLEGGIGATFMSHTRFANENFSTSFQFGDHLGFGRVLGDDYRIGIRFSHFSNASIKKPNPGLNIIQLTLSKSF